MNDSNQHTPALPGFSEPETNPTGHSRQPRPIPETNGPDRTADPSHPRPLGDYPELMTVQEAAEYLRIAPSTCYVLTKQYVDTHGTEGVPARKIGGRTMIHRSTLEAWLSANPT